MATVIYKENVIRWVIIDTDIDISAFSASELEHTSTDDIGVEVQEEGWSGEEVLGSSWSKN